MKIGIVGGGFTGLELAYGLSKQGHRISIFEQENQLGGLATFHDYSFFYWDRFYHVILPSDEYLINFIHEIGLGSKIRWRNTLTGFYVDQKLYSISNTLEFLRFPPLNLFNKMRLAFTILYCSRIKNWRSLEKTTVEEWLVKLSGRKTYEKMWKPLLLAKLGENYNRVSAVFIWTYIKRLFSARHSTANKEQLGHVEGGYKTVLNHIENILYDRGGTIYLNTIVESIYPHSGNGIIVKYNGKEEKFDKVVFTAPVNVLEKTTSDSLMEINGKWMSVEYLGVICVILITCKPLVPYYIVNIADERVPFTGIIGMSNVVDIQETQGYHVTYLPKYLLSDDSLLRESDDDIIKLFLNGLFYTLPDFNEKDIVAIHVNRAFKVQPLQVLDYSEIAPKVTTKHPDFFVLNTSQFLYDTLNNNSVTRHVHEFLKNFAPSFKIDINIADSIITQGSS